MRPTRKTTPPTTSVRLRVESYMTPDAYAIRPDESLGAAHAMMRDHDIRHLPVLDAGKLVGIVTQRDLHLVETLGGVDQSTVPVEEAMSTDVYAVPPEAPLARVAEEMAERKIGSAVVMEDDEVVGIFTTVDALRGLADILRRVS
jgi:acetoin utilization protein AcuB